MTFLPHCSVMEAAPSPSGNKSSSLLPLSPLLDFLRGRVELIPAQIKNDAAKH
jgi:hypothetical protein